jgi:flagellar hook-associated protein 2
MTVTQDTSSTRNKIKDFVSRFNALMDYVSDQRQAYLDGETDNIGSDALLRSLRSNLVSSISKTIGGGTYCNLAEIGLEFEQDGTISFNSNKFDDAVESDGDSVERLLSGFGSTKGVFQGIESTIKRYTEAGGLVLNAKERNEDQVTKFEDQISQLKERLSIKAASLTAEYSAADQVMQTLNQQKSALTALLG